MLSLSSRFTCDFLATYLWPLLSYGVINAIHSINVTADFLVI